LPSKVSSGPAKAGRHLILSKLSTGYWNIADSTNGYTAIHASVLRHLPLEKISRRYFFESDMLFRLNTLRAVVVDVPMDAVYDGAASSLQIARILPEFAGKHLRNFAKRMFYNYFLRDVSVASLELPAGVALLAFALGFGGYHWARSAAEGVATPTGTITITAVTLLRDSSSCSLFCSTTSRRFRAARSIARWPGCRRAPFVRSQRHERVVCMAHGGRYDAGSVRRPDPVQAGSGAA
jgi:hypothetical protein